MQPNEKVDNGEAIKERIKKIKAQRVTEILTVIKSAGDSITST